MKHKLIKTIFFASFIWLAGVILTQGTLRAADTIVYAIKIGTQALGTLDLNTAVYTQISPTAISEYELGVFGGVLYGGGGQCGCLFQINPSTGAVTPAPTYFQQNNSGFGVMNGFGSTTDGLFAMAAAVPGGVNYLWSVNPATGVPTQIGSTGVVAGGGTAYLSASNDSNKLYWEFQNNCTDILYSINTSTGAATLIGSAGSVLHRQRATLFRWSLPGALYGRIFTVRDLGRSAPQPALRPWFRPARTWLSSEWLRIPSRRHRRRTSARWGILPRKGTGPQRSRSSTKAGPSPQRS